MKAFILNSNFSSYIVYNNEDLLKRQLRLLSKFEITDLYFLYKNNNIDKYCMEYDLHYTIIDNISNVFDGSLEDDILILNGDSVFSEYILSDILAFNTKAAALNSYADISGITIDKNNIVKNIDINTIDKYNR